MWLRKAYKNSMGPTVRPFLERKIAYFLSVIISRQKVLQQFLRFSAWFKAKMSNLAAYLKSATGLRFLEQSRRGFKVYRSFPSCYCRSIPSRPTISQQLSPEGVQHEPM